MSTNDYSNMNCVGMIFDGQDLSNADFANADLGGASLRGCILDGARFVNADLSGADLSGSNLSKAILDGCSILDVIGIEWRAISSATRDYMRLLCEIKHSKCPQVWDEKAGRYDGIDEEIYHAYIREMLPF